MGTVGLRMTHTPGPWGISMETNEQHETKWYITVDETLVAEVEDGPDARLIAAAPDLLAALEAVCVSQPGMMGLPDDQTPDHYAMAKVAIAKAKGQE